MISLEFDPKGTDGNVFKNVNIYDSMKITPRMQETKINNKSSYGVVLKNSTIHLQIRIMGQRSRTINFIKQ